MAERSSEERDAARLERERRRAGRDSSQGEPEPVVATAPPEDGHFDYEEPAGTRWVSRGSRVAPAKRPPASGRPLKTKRPHSKRRRLLALIPLAIAIAIVWFAVELFQPFHGSAHGH